MGPELDGRLGPLPYFIIPTKHGDMRFLIDCASNTHILSTRWTNRVRKDLLRVVRPETITGVTGSSTIDQTLDIPLFSPMYKKPLTFHLLDFHSFFDGLVGTEFLLNPKVRLLLHEAKLRIMTERDKYVDIPIHFYTPNQSGKTCNALTMENKIRIDHLSQEEKELLVPALESVSHVFHDPDNKLTCTTKVECDIRTTDEIPVYQKSYPYPMCYKEEVNNQIQKLLTDGIIRPSRSAWNSPVWIVPKKEDASGVRKFRLVVDFRKVNEKTTSDRYPMPEISTILDQLKGCTYFTTLDLASGFHQIRMRPEDVQKTAFSVNNGKYEYLRMPFGLKNAPSIFQRAMDDVLREHIGTRCYVYMDDVVVFGKTLDEHVHNLKLILDTLSDANLKVQLDKSEFLHKSIEFLGYIVTDKGIKPNEKKIKAIQEWPVPKNLKELRGFLGLMGYYRRFVKDFAKIAKPLTTLLRGERNPNANPKIALNEEQLGCFSTMKELITSENILTYPDFEKIFLITTDASNVALGAVLSQGEIGKDKPICFASRTLNKAEENYSASEKEMLAIIWALKVFRNYIYGQKFKIITDHQPLTFTLSPKNTNAKLKRWKAYLEEHDYEIIYKPGRSNVVADALSRIQTHVLTSTQHSADEDDSNFIPTTEGPLNAFRHQVILEKSNSDSESTTIPFPGFRRIHVKRRQFDRQQLINILRDYFDPSKLDGLYSPPEIMTLVQDVYKEFFNRSGLLKIRYTQRILEDVSDTQRQEEIIRSTHERAHRGIAENKLQILRDYYFPRMTQKVRTYIQVCDICNVSKYDRKPLKIHIQETPIPTFPYQIVHLDIYQIERQLFLSSVDKFSKYGRMIPIQSHQTIHVEQAFWDSITSHIVPDIVVIDNEAAFRSPNIRGRMLDLNIQVYCTPSHRSEVNGPVERFHSTINELYRIQKNIHQDWPCQDLVATAVEKYNNTIHSATQKTPKEILLGRNQETLTPEQLSDIRQRVYDEVIVKLKEAQTKQNMANDKRNEPPMFTQDQMVYTKDKIIKAEHKNRFKKCKVKEDNQVTFLDSRDLKIHKENVKNIGIKS